MGGRVAVPAAVCAWLGLLAGAGCARGGAETAAGAPWLVAGALLAAAAALGSRGLRDPEAPFDARRWLHDAWFGTLVLGALFAAAGARGAAHAGRLEAARARIDEAGLTRIAGRAVSPPLRESGEPTVIVAVDAATPPMPAGTRVRLRLRPGSPAEWGDRIEALARLDRPRPAANPGGFDGRALADAASIVASGRALDARALRATGPAAWPRASAARWRRAIERRLAAHLDPGARALVTPLVIGDRSGMPPDLSAALRASGLVHLIALSGLHVAWLAAAARGAAAAAGGGPGARAVAGSLAAIAYVGLAGPIPSLLRAASFEALSAAARLARRPLDPVHALGGGAIFLLAVAPGFAGDLGFQLSCAATLGLGVLGPPITRALAGPPGERAPRLVRHLVRLRAAAATVVAPTLAAQIPAWPLLAAAFHAASWTGPLANLIAVPVCGLLLAAAWIGVLVDGAAPGAGRAWLAACGPLAAALHAIAGAAARAPLAMVPFGHESAVPGLATIATALLAFGFGGPRADLAAARGIGPARFATRCAGATFAAIAAALALTAPPALPPPGRWWMIALDVGQGDAVALGFRDGWWLVDAGPRTPHHDAGESVVLPFLRWSGVRRLEAVVLTHDDGDHTGGATAVLRSLPVASRWGPAPLPRVPGPARRFATRPASRGDTLRRSPPVVALWPPPPASPEAVDLATDNRGSLVLLAGDGRGRALLAADADSTVELRLAASGPVAALKVAHHGSGSSSGARWLLSLRPALAVVACGRRNGFGHPDPGVLARLGGCGARVLRTDRQGAVWIEFGADGARVLDWRAADPTARRAARPAPGEWTARAARAGDLGWARRARDPLGADPRLPPAPVP
jgi:competence protein ComEC